MNNMISKEVKIQHVHDTNNTQSQFFVLHSGNLKRLSLNFVMVNPFIVKYIIIIL